MLLKIKLKTLASYLIFNAILLTLAYFLNRFLPMLMFILFFSFMRGCFYYNFHADSITDNPIKAVRLCKLITIIVELVYLAFCQPLDISVYSNLLIIFTIALINCLVEFGIEHSVIRYDQFRDKDTLLLLCNNAHLTKNATDRMILKYVENKTYKEIADLECVDIQSIKISINRSRKKIMGNQE